jgi:hypothetical protein
MRSPGAIIAAASTALTVAACDYFTGAIDYVRIQAD